MFVLKRRSYVALLGVVLAAGCQLDGRTDRAGASRSVEVAEPPVRLQQPQVADVQVAFGRTFEKSGELERAEAAYTEALKKDPKRADAWVRLAVIADRQGKFSRSRECYQKALALQPRDADLHCNLGYSHYLQHRWSEAEHHFRHALSLQPDHPRAHNNLGLVLARTGRADDALAEFRRGGCSEADSRVNLAYAATLSKQWPQARDHYQAALRLEPTSGAAQKGMNQLQALEARATEVAGAMVQEPASVPEEEASSFAAEHAERQASWRAPPAVRDDQR
jgi:Tfp pilus assembly protein PilF